jgi:TolB-like protein/Flp pilus assembly protein TadD
VTSRRKDSAGFLAELRQRQVFPLAGLYVFGAWVVIEVSSVLFPAWAIPDTALRYLFVAAAVLFPIVLLFGWLFDVRRDGVYRSEKTGTGDITAVALSGRDYALLSGLSAVSIAILLVTLMQVWNAVEPAPDAVAIEVARTENSVAVLPFANLDPNPDTGYFSDGVSEEILHRLASNRALHVLGRSSSFAFRGSGLALADISKVLGVEYLLEGSVRRDGDVVRVTARLTDQAGAQVWSETFDRRLEAIFAIQSEIAGAVAARIAAEIVSSNDQSRLRSTDSLEAYNEYLIGRSYTRSRSPDWNEKAEAAFRRAIEFDGNYAPAYAGLAYALFVQRGELEEALVAAEMALQLDSEFAEANALMGILTLWNGDRYENAPAAEKFLRHAIEIDPSYAESYNWLAIALQYLDREDDAFAVLEQGYAIDPLSPSLVTNLSAHYARQGEFERAKRMKLRLMQLPDPPNLAKFTLMQMYMDWGRYADTLRFIESLGEPELWWQARMANYAALGMMERANALLEQHADDSDSDSWLFIAAYVLQAQGRHEEAFARTQHSLESAGQSIDALPPNATAWAAGIYAFAGRHDKVTGLYEDHFGGDLEAFGRHTETGQFLNAAAAIAFSYQQTGQEAKGRAILNTLLDNPFLANPPPAPLPLYSSARLQSMSGDEESAFRRLSEAVDLGWAGYYEATNDPRWGDTLKQPRFVELLDRAQANLTTQRAQVEQQDFVTE